MGMKIPDFLNWRYSISIFKNPATVPSASAALATHSLR